jgi:methionyl-tRNA formyltransferase
MLRHYLNDILAGHIMPTPQDDSASTYAPMIRKEAGEIDWRQDAEALDRLIRAMTPWPGAFTWWGGEALKILRARPAPGGLPDVQPGRVVSVPDGVAVVAAEGGLLLDEVQLSGKRAMPAADFARGRPDWIGSVLGKVDA